MITGTSHVLVPPLPLSLRSGSTSFVFCFAGLVPFPPLSGRPDGPRWVGDPLFPACPVLGPGVGLRVPRACQVTPALYYVLIKFSVAVFRQSFGLVVSVARQVFMLLHFMDFV